MQKMKPSKSNIRQILLARQYRLIVCNKPYNPASLKKGILHFDGGTGAEDEI